MPYGIECGEDPYCRERYVERPATGHRGVGAFVCLCHRKVCQQLYGRPLQHQAFHGHGPYRFIDSQPYRGDIGYDQRPHRPLVDGFLCMFLYHVGSQRLVSIDGSRPCYHSLVAVVFAQRTGHLLWIFQCKPQPGRVFLVYLCRLGRWVAGLASRIHGFVSGRS